MASDAIDHAQKTTISADEWLLRVSKGKYRYAATEWYKAVKALEAEAKTPVTPPVAPVAGIGAVQRMCVVATNTRYVYDQAVKTGLKIYVCADPNYVNHPENPLTDAMITQIGQSGNGPYAWIGPDLHADAVAALAARCKRLGYPLKAWAGEGETQEGYDEHTKSTNLIIGNLSALTTAQVERVAKGEVLFCWERYLNKPDQRASYQNGNFGWATGLKGFGGYCAAVYGSPSSSDFAVRTPMQWYVDNGAWNPQTDSVYTQGMENRDAQAEADWKILGA